MVERKNRHILGTTKAIMFQMNVPKKYWSHSVLTAKYLINRLSSRITDLKSPLKVLSNKKHDISHLRVFVVFVMFTNKQYIVTSLILN